MIEIRYGILKAPIGEGDFALRRLVAQDLGGVCFLT